MIVHEVGQVERLEAVVTGDLAHQNINHLEKN